MDSLSPRFTALFLGDFQTRRRQAILNPGVEWLKLSTFIICDVYRSHLEISRFDEQFRCPDFIFRRFQTGRHQAISNPKLDMLRLSPLNICNFHRSNHRLSIFDQFHVTRATDVQIFLSKISGQQFESVFWVVESINQDHLRFPEHPNSKHSFCVNSGQGRQWNDVDSGRWELDPLRLEFLSKTLFVQGFW